MQTRLDHEIDALKTSREQKAEIADRLSNAIRERKDANEKLEEIK